tara:strand:+ start:717 stop:1586 length:870 start_codon:yes stop_codon:yes gene_type:complete
MPQDNLLKKIKELREITGVGFKDCKSAIDETKGDIEKSIVLLRKKGIAKINKRMSRVAAEGLIYISEKDNNISLVEINSETDFVARNKDFINFGKEVSDLSLSKSGKIEDLLNAKMKNNKIVNDNLIDLVSKIGEKITLRRTAFVSNSETINFSYVHSAIEKNIGKLGVLLSLKTKKKDDSLLSLGKELSMHIAASTPLALSKENLDPNIVNKEKEIIMDELKNSGKDKNIIEKISLGKINKFIMDNTLLNQEWIIDPKKKVKDIIKEYSQDNKIEIVKFIRFKVGEGL